MSYQSKKHFPDSNVYINKLDIRDQKLLEEAESEFTSIRQMELIREPITDGKWDMKHLQKIHKYLFQDVYDFAGEIRTEQLQKGHTQFASPLYLEEYGKDVFKQLKNDNHLKDLPKDQFCERLAYYMGEVNMVHPFYEGNGRATREFFRTLAMSKGYTLDWKQIDKNELMNSSIRSVVDHKPLAETLNKGIMENEPSKEVMNEWIKQTEYELE